MIGANKVVKPSSTMIEIAVSSTLTISNEKRYIVRSSNKLTQAISMLGVDIISPHPRPMHISPAIHFIW
jgi:hypothetical protein